MGTGNSLDQWRRSIAGSGRGPSSPREKSSSTPTKINKLCMAMAILFIYFLCMLLSSSTVGKLVFTHSVHLIQTILMSVLYPSLVYPSLVGSRLSWYLSIPLLLYNRSVGAIASSNAEVTPSHTNPSILEVIAMAMVVLIVLVVMSGKFNMGSMSSSLRGSGKNKREELSSRETKRGVNHPAPEGKKSSTSSRTFVQKHLRDKVDLPAELNQSSDANDYTNYFTRGLNNEINSLKKTAKKIKKKHNASCHHINASSNSTNKKDQELLVIMQFPPDNQKIQDRGPLYTHIRTSFDKKKRRHKYEPCNVPPQNPSIFGLIETIANIISLEYGIGHAAAIQIIVQISVLVDMIPFTLPVDSGNNGGSALYKDAKAQSAEDQKKYIQGLIKNLQHLKCIIVLGLDAWYFVEEMRKAGMISGDIKIVQHSAVVHPTKELKWGINQREAHWFYQCIQETFAFLIDPTTSVSVSTEEEKSHLRVKVRTVFANRNNLEDTKGCFIYTGVYMGDLLLVSRGYGELVTLIRGEEDGSLPTGKNGTFPLSRDLIASPTGYNFRGLQLDAVWFEDYNYANGFGIFNQSRMKKWVAEALVQRGDDWIKTAEEKKGWAGTGMAYAKNSALSLFGGK